MTDDRSDSCELFIEASSGRFLRKVLSTSTEVWMMPIGTQGWPFPRSHKAFKEARDTGAWKPVPPAPPEPPEQGLVELRGEGSKKAQAHGEDTVKKLGFHSVELLSLMTPEGRTAHLKESNVHRSTYYKHLRRWLEDGLTALSLAARWHGRPTNVDRSKLETLDMAIALETVRAYSLKLQKAGKPDDATKTCTADGRPRKRTSRLNPTRYRVDDWTLRVFLKYYKKKKADGQLRLGKLYDDMRQEVFATQQPYGAPQQWPLWSVPSRSMFEYYYRVLFTHVERKKVEDGTHNFDLKSRRLASSVSLAFAAGRIGELDATIWNVELVGEGPDAPIIGPAVVFRCRCKDTGELLGLAVGLESAGWYGAAAAIANCMEDKDEYCRRIGLPPLALKWVARGLPIQIDADQGETYNDKPRLFIRRTGVPVVSMPAARGDLKPGVESDWNTLQVRLNEITPGAAIKRYEDEHGVKWHMKASMTLKQFTQMLVLEEIKKMHLPRVGVKLPQEMIAAGVDTSPHSMFVWSMKHGAGYLKQVDETKTRLALLPVMKVSMTERGITLDGVHFTCDAIDLANAASHARVHGRKKLRVAIDPLLVDRVWLIMGDKDAPTAYAECHLNLQFVNQRSYIGKTWREVKDLIVLGKKTNADHAEIISQGIAELSRIQAQIATESQQRKNNARAEFPSTETALIRNRDAARLEEKNLLSPDLAITASIVTAEPASKQAAAEVTQPTDMAPAPAPASSPKPSRFARLSATVAPSGA